MTARRRTSSLSIAASLLALVLALVLSGREAEATSLYDASAYEYFQNDFYGALGLRFDDAPSSQDIKRAYRRLSRDLHPDRNPDAPAHRFQEIVRAKEILGDETLRADYDDFIAGLPRGFRPVYGRERSAFRVSKTDPVVVVTGGLLVFIGAISYLQRSQWKRERARATSSVFFKEQLAAATSQGVSEEEFMSIFLEANPEFARSWPDTAGAALLRALLGLCRVRPRALQPTALPNRHRDEDLRETVEDRQALDESEALRQQKLEAERLEKARRKRQASDKRTVKRREAQRQQRLNRLNAEFDADVALVMLDLGADTLAGFRGGEGVLYLEQMRAALREIVETRMDEYSQDFWEHVFEEAFAVVAENRFDAQEREQEALMAAERERVRALQESEMFTTSKAPAPNSGRDEAPDGAAENDDDEWGRELAEREHLKREKREAAKRERQAKAAQSRLANEERKAAQKKSKSKKK